MNWLSRIFTKQSAVGSLISAHVLGRPVFPKRNFTNYAKEAYQLNIVAYRCIELISTAAASVPWVLWNDDTDEEVKKHPILDLLHRPNPAQSGKELFTAVYAHDLLTGNSYIERVAVDGGARIQELWSLRPDRMKIIPGKFGLPARFEYAVGNVEPKGFPSDPITGMSDILHVKRFNPLDDWYGQSPLEALGMSVDSHNESTKWNYALLKNGARPSGVLQAEGTLDENEYDRLKKELDEGYSSTRSGKPMLLQGGLTWVQMMLSQMDMDWLKGKERAASEIAVGYKVPEQLVGVPGQQTYNNYREARMALYEDAVLPLLDRYAECLTYWLKTVPGLETYCLSYDEDKIHALAPRRESMWDKLENAKFLTIDEKREALGYEPYEPDTKIPGSVIFISASDIPLEGAAPSGDQTNPDGTPMLDENGDPLGSMESALTGTRAAPVQDLALNGAQIAAVVQIVQAVADKQLPPESAVQLLLVSFPSIDEAAAHLMVDPAADFEPKPPEPPPGAMMPGVPAAGGKPAVPPKKPTTPAQKLVLCALLQMKSVAHKAFHQKAYGLAYGIEPQHKYGGVNVNVSTPDVHVHAPSVNVDARTSIDAGAVQVSSPVDIKQGDTHLITNSPDGDTITTYERDPDTKEIVSSTKSIKEKK